LRPFEYQPYDWYHEEKSLRPLEKVKRTSSKLIGEELNREMRRGGRTTLLVHLDAPEVPEKHLTVVSPHLENRTRPQRRRKQMEELLRGIQHISNPVVVAGDLNTTGGDGEAFKLERSLKKKFGEAEFWVNAGIKYATGVGAAYDLMKFGFRFTKNLSDPTAQHVPFFAPNYEEALFDMLEAFHFQDGKAFDFRGIPECTINSTGGVLSNSNQRSGKGFVPTYEFIVTVSVVGKYKLDWMFVKSYLNDSGDLEGPNRFAPHFARTMTSINLAFPDGLSDHNPMTVDLPFGEPTVELGQK
jgi:hypothetical protein